jgi:N-acetylgalactosamine PTS system EIIC component
VSLSWLAVTLWGGIVGVDDASFPQAMVSRPLPAATLAGLVLGRPLEGAVIGALLEAFSLTTLPVGAARFPEVGTAAVAAMGAYAAAATGRALDPVLVLLAIVFALAWQRLTGVSVTLFRHLNERLAAVPLDSDGVDSGWIVHRHLLALLADLARGMVVTVVGVAVGGPVLARLRPLWGLDAASAVGVLTVCAAAFAASALSLFGGLGQRKRTFLAGVACGLLLLVIVR